MHRISQYSDIIFAWGQLLNLLDMTFVIFPLVSFPGHPDQTSPPNTLDKVSNPESSLSGFPGHSKIESSKVGRPASLPHTLLRVYLSIRAIKTSLLVMPDEEWSTKVADGSVGAWSRVLSAISVCLCYLQQTDTRRITHISAEQKRRFNIKLGFDTLHNLVTTLSSQPSIKVQSPQCSWAFAHLDRTCKLSPGYTSCLRRGGCW